MKKYLLLIAAVFFISAYADAQRRYPRGPRRPPIHQPRTYNPNQVRFGVAGGVNLSNIIKDGDPNFSTDTKVGANVGLFVQIPVSRQISFQPELLYSQKGYRAITRYGEFSQRSNFIDLPLLLKLHLTPGFHAVIGPQVSFLMSTKNIYRDGFSTTVIDEYNRDTDGFNKNLLAGVVGVGFDLNRNVDLHARYAIDLQKSNLNGTADFPDFRNQVWQIGLGYKF
jgi:opacity protein-like surface antigen